MLFLSIFEFIFWLFCTYFYLFQVIGGGFKVKKRYDDFLYFTKSSYHLVIIVTCYHCNQSEFTARAQPSQGMGKPPLIRHHMQHHGLPGIPAVMPLYGFRYLPVSYHGFLQQGVIGQF